MSLFDPQPNFVEHDTFLFAVLGLASVNEKWEELVVSSSIHCHIVDEDPIVSNKDMPLPVDNVDDDVVLALLGIFSLSGRVQNVLRDWTHGAQVMTEEPTPGTFGFDQIDDLLR